MILVIDNYDSFTYNLVQYLGELGEALVVRRNDAITVDVIQRWGAEIPTLGVCLGHQAIGQAYGGEVVRARRVMHGKTSRIEHGGDELFAGLPSPLEVMRYHSLVVEPSTLPAELEVLARAQTDATEIHAVRHRKHPVWGVQFHPESIMTQNGKDILRNFLELTQ